LVPHDHDTVMDLVMQYGAEFMIRVGHRSLKSKQSVNN